VNWSEKFDGFHFHDHLVLDNHVGPKSSIDADAFINDSPNSNLLPGLNSWDHYNLGQSRFRSKLWRSLPSWGDDLNCLRRIHRESGRQQTNG
jgi:hypothetical protein